MVGHRCDSCGKFEGDQTLMHQWIKVCVNLDWGTDATINHRHFCSKPCAVKWLTA